MFLLRREWFIEGAGYTKERVMSRHVLSGNIGEHAPQHAPNRHRKWDRKRLRRHTKYIEHGCGNGNKNLEREAVVLHRKSSTPSVWLRDCY